jgi:hypothetical protein
MVRDRVTVRGGVGTYFHPPWRPKDYFPGKQGRCGVQEMCAKTGEQSLAGMRRETAQLVPSSWYWERTLISPVRAWTKSRVTLRTATFSLGVLTDIQYLD